MEGTRLLVQFVQEDVDFRVPELQSLADLFGIRIEYNVDEYSSDVCNMFAYYKGRVLSVQFMRMCVRVCIYVCVMYNCYALFSFVEKCKEGKSALFFTAHVGMHSGIG